MKVIRKLRDTPVKGIYVIRNLVNGKTYVGQSIDVEKRWEQQKKCPNEHLKRAFVKYGFENFSFELLEETDDLDAREKFWIASYDSTDPSKGYNMSHGGKADFFAGCHHTDASKEKARQSAPDRRGEKNPMYGKNAYDGKTEDKMKEIGARLSKSQSGRKVYYDVATGKHVKVKPEDATSTMLLVEEHKELRQKKGVRSEEVRAKMSASAKARGAPVCAFRDKRGEKNPMYGKAHSETSRTKASLTKASRTSVLLVYGSRGRKWYHDPVTFRTRLCSEKEIPSGWLLGRHEPVIKDDAVHYEVDHQR